MKIVSRRTIFNRYILDFVYRKQPKICRLPTRSNTFYVSSESAEIMNTQSQKDIFTFNNACSKKSNGG
jgi:hypothetical protein